VKIIFICTKSITFNTFLKSQADYLRKKGFEIEVACSDSEKLYTKINEKFEISFPGKISELFSLLKYIKIFKQIQKLIKYNPNSIFFLHTPIASHLFRFFTFLNKLKIIYFVHGFRFTSSTNSIKNFFFRSVENILSLKTDIFITINKEDYNFVKLNYKKETLCYKINGVGIDFLKIKKIKKKEIKKILVIAAYKKEKGYLELLKLAEMIKHEKIKITCYGYGKSNRFKKIKIKKKLNNISFKRFDINLNKKIKNYDLLLHLSKREGLPVSLIQSLSFGLPVICYDKRGNNDLIKDKFNGYFIKSYKEAPNKIFYLNLEESIFYKMRLNAIKSIGEDFLKKKINFEIYNIIKKYSKLKK
tara:strand:+ start:463 stop:1539 length:1077 start_codon:yes stop_codon:yes gene_type:complete